MAAALLAAGLAAEPAAADEQRACLNKSEQRAAISNGQAVPLADAMRSVRSVRTATRSRGSREVIKARLCRRGQRPRLCADSALPGWQSDAHERRCDQRQGRRRPLTGRHSLASPRDRGRSRPQPPARHRADRRGLRGRPRFRRRGGPLSRRDRALRRGDPRHRPAEDGRHLGAGVLAPRRPRHAGADADRARPLERQGAGLRRRRRRLCREAVSSRGGAGAHPRAAAPLRRSRQERIDLRAGAARHPHRPRRRSTAIRSSSPATNTGCCPT